MDFMKKRVTKKIIAFAIVIVVVFTLIFIVNRDPSIQEYKIDSSDYIQPRYMLEEIPLNDLSQEEIDGLILMREEEKLARDVYLFLGEKWHLNIFNNIAESEQTHTDAVKFLLDRYSIEDPVKPDKLGVFDSKELSGIYDSLIEKGINSLFDALIVGATVEDLDIKDLEDLLGQTDNEDIKVTYENLQKGSRNHLRAFVRQIEKNGGEYSPSYISNETYNAIISTSQERGSS